MSYNHNIYVGWYAEFPRSKRQVKTGVKKVRFCPTSTKHSTKDKFCPTCGSEIQGKEEMQYKSFPISYHIFGSDQEELDYMTGSLIKAEDLEALGNCQAIFPEFLGTDKEIIMAPGYNYFSDVSRSDGFVEEIDNQEKPDEEWIDKIKKVFDTLEVCVKFGIVMEIV